MIVRPKHFEFDREKSRELAELADDQTLSKEQRDLIPKSDMDQPFFTEPATHCFYCGEKLTIPAVAWNGHDRRSADAVDIWLHPKCAEHLSARLSRDADELKIGKQGADERLASWKQVRPFR